MDVHRCRFVPHATSSISALAFSSVENDSEHGEPAGALKLAIGRANGNLEIWSPQEGLWVQETVFVGNSSSIDALVWTRDPDEKDSEVGVLVGQHRLFSIASSPAVMEWDLATGRVLRQSTGNFSEVWCFAAQPRHVQQASELVAGCGDGTLVLISTAEQDLQFKRTLARVSGKRARCMCVAYQSRDRVVAGFADSVIRVYDTRKATLLRSMSLGVGVPGAPKNTLVWQVRCLPDGSIVSGDSNGEIRVWDGKMYSLIQRIAGHETDCLDLVASRDGRMLISGSISGKIAVYRQSTKDGRALWSRSSHRRLHGGEVKAMAAFDSDGMSVLVAGGSEAPVVTPLRDYGKENIRFLPSLSQRPSVVSASRARLLASCSGKTVSIWHMGKQPQLVDTQSQRSRKLVARINIDSKHDIQAFAISADGRALAVGTATTVKVFQLRRRPEDEALAIRKLDVPAGLASEGARLLEFSPDGHWLLVGTLDGDVYLARLAQHQTKPKMLQILPKYAELDRQPRRSSPSSTFWKYDRILNLAAFSADSRVLAVSDLSGHLDSWVLHGEEDLSKPATEVASQTVADDGSDSDSSEDSDDDDESKYTFFGQRWTSNPAASLLPKLPSMPLVLTFRPQYRSSRASIAPNGLLAANAEPAATEEKADEPAQEQPAYRLWIMTAKHDMFEFDVLAGRLSDWSRKNPTSTLPTPFVKIRDRVMSAVWDISEQHERLWLHGPSFVCMLNVCSDQAGSAQPSSARKRRKSAAAAEHHAVLKRQRLKGGAGGTINPSRREGLSSGEMMIRYDGEDRSVVNARDAAGHDAGANDPMDWSIPHAGSGGDEQALTSTGEEAVDADRGFWCSFRWGPIMGMVPLESEAGMNGDMAFEVAIVEGREVVLGKK